MLKEKEQIIEDSKCDKEKLIEIIIMNKMKYK